jgi:hypothetical protein
MANSVKDFTASKLEKMKDSGNHFSSKSIDDTNARADDFGMTAAGASNSSIKFKRGGAVHGAAMKPRMDRAVRKAGGKVKKRADGGDVDPFDQDMHVISKEPSNGWGEPGRGRGTNMAMPAIDRLFKGDPQPGHSDSDYPVPSQENYPARGGEGGNNKSNLAGHRRGGGRVERAKGGRVGKGKTQINIIVGGGKPQGAQPMPVPVPVPAGGGAPPMPPPRPPMPVMPVGGAPVGAGMPPGAMPPGGMPPPMMGRKRGGAVYQERAGSGSGNARIDKARAGGKSGLVP